MARKSLLYLLLLAGLCISMPAGHAATLTYTGDQFFTVRTVPMCVRAMDDLGTPVRGEPVLFRALDLWDIARTRPLNLGHTDGAGGACANAFLQPGVYEAQAFGAEGGGLEGAASKPTVITVVDESRRFWGMLGKMEIRERLQPNGRQASFGIYYDFGAGYPTDEGYPIMYSFYPQGRTEQFLLLDPDAPQGPVRVRMREFKQAYERRIWRSQYFLDLLDRRLIGYCDFTVGDSKPVTRYCEVVLDYYGRDWFYVEVKDFAQRTIYRANGLYWAYWWEFG